MAIGHVGDSRAYRLRRGKLERLTRDHSLVEEMRRKGQLTEAQAEDHPQRSIITRALGPEPEVEVDLQTVPAQAGDVFLICSDGLTSMLDDEHIGRLLDRATSMQNAVRALIDEANRAGGRDNISVIAFKVVDAAEPALDSASEGATLIGSTAEEAGLTATEVRRRAAGDAARQRREEQAAKKKPGRRRKRGQTRRRCPRRAGRDRGDRLRRRPTACATSGSSAPTTPAASPSTAACPTNCPSGSSSGAKNTPPRCRPSRCPKNARTR